MKKNLFWLIGLLVVAMLVLLPSGPAEAGNPGNNQNFSKTSFDKNRELGILETSTPTLSMIRATFDQDWNKNGAE